jgi:hypothetical protein
LEGFENIESKRESSSFGYHRLYHYYHHPTHNQHTKDLLNGSLQDLKRIAADMVSVKQREFERQRQIQEHLDADLVPVFDRPAATGE